jgi:hypothetical protein
MKPVQVNTEEVLNVCDSIENEMSVRDCSVEKVEQVSSVAEVENGKDFAIASDEPNDKDGRKNDIKNPPSSKVGFNCQLIKYESLA